MKNIIRTFLFLTIFIFSFSGLIVSANSYSGNYGDNINYFFDSTTGMLTISGTGDMPDNIGNSQSPWEKYKNKITSVVIENGVTSIGGQAFYDCNNLSSITIPDTVTRIGQYAFVRCYSITKIVLPDTLTEIGNGAFYACKNLSSINIPDGVTVLGFSLFECCEKLENITLPNNLETIDDRAFWGSGITSVSITDNIKSVGLYTFEACGKLEEVTIDSENVAAFGEIFFGQSSIKTATIGKNVTNIGRNLFYGCHGLQYITIPNTVTNICDSAFEYCDNIGKIYYNGTKDEWDKIIIGASNDYLAQSKIEFTNQSKNANDSTEVNYETIDNSDENTEVNNETIDNSDENTEVNDKIQKKSSDNFSIYLVVGIVIVLLIAVATFIIIGKTRHSGSKNDDSKC